MFLHVTLLFLYPFQQDTRRNFASYTPLRPVCSAERSTEIANLATLEMAKEEIRRQSTRTTHILASAASSAKDYGTCNSSSTSPTSGSSTSPTSSSSTSPTSSSSTFPTSSSSTCPTSGSSTCC